MRRHRLAAVLALLTVPVACASLYGVSDLPSAVDAGADAGAHDAKPDVVARHDAHTGLDAPSRDSRVDARSSDAGSDDAGHDAGHDAAHDAALAALAVSPNPAEIAPGGMVTLTITLAAPAAAPENIVVTGLPSGVTAGAAAIPSGSTTGTVTLSGNGSVTASVTAFQVTVGAAVGTGSLITPGATAALDTTFNQSGVRNTIPAGGGSGSTPEALAVQPNGAILVGGASASGNGAWELVRINEDGTLDTAFNANVVDVNQGALMPSTGYVAGVGVLPSGQIVVEGFDNGNASLGVMLFNADGTRYAAFGTNGLYEDGPPQSLIQNQMTAAGGIAVNASGDFAAVSNLMTSGTSNVLITQFTGASHTAQKTHFASPVYAEGIVYQSSGDIVIGGYTSQYGAQFYVKEFTPSLSAVSGFGGDFGPDAGSTNQYLTSVGLAEDTAGNLYVAGTDNSADPAPALLTMTSAGVAQQAKGYVIPGPFSPMNGSGYVGIACGPTPGVAMAIANGYDMAGNIVLLARLKFAGGLDTSFNGTGYVTSNTSMTITYNAVAVDPFGRIIVAGNEGSGFYTFRMWP